MCWISGGTAIRKIAERDFYVYKIGQVMWNNIFISHIKRYQYIPKCPNRTIPLILATYGAGGDIIREGYHSYLTKETALYYRGEDEIGIFEIPAGATIYVNYKRREIVSTNIRYLGLLES